MDKQTPTQIKLNIPCWICDKDLILEEAITTFGDNSHKSPAHLDCVLKEQENRIVEIIEKMFSYPRAINSMNEFCKLEEDLIKEIKGQHK